MSSPPHARPPLRVGIIGCGPIGALHAAAVRASPSARLVAVCDIDGPRAQQLADRLGGGVVPRDRAEDMLEVDAADVVTVATPDHLHVPAALLAIEAGRHVFCEKPLATTSAEANLLVDAAKDKGVTLGVDYNRRFGFGYSAAHEWLRAGRLGELGHLSFHVLDRTPPPRVARIPEVILTTLLTHHIDLARWFGGEIDTIAARFGPANDGVGGIRRNVVLTLGFASRNLGVIVAGYRDSQRRTAERAAIVGSLGAVEVRDVTRAAIFWSDDPDCREVREPPLFGAGGDFDGTITAHVRAFLQAIAAGDPAPVSGADGLAGLRIVDAALLSHASEGAVVPVENP